MLATLAAFGTGCGNAKPPETVASDGTHDAAAEVAVSTSLDGGAAGTGIGAGTGSPHELVKDECVAFDITNLEDVLLKSACEEPSIKPDSLPTVDLKGKLTVTLTASPSKPTPGGKVDLLVSYTNKTAEPLTLHFKLDPLPRFEVEAYDTKKMPKRADLPMGSAPPPPNGASQPSPSEAKSARMTIAPNGTVRARVPWEAVKTKWAPERFRGSVPERGYPRAPAGPLPKGKYGIRVVSPLVGVSEGVDHELSTPRVELDIGG